MRKVFVIGIGAGNPEYVTVQAINALNQVDVFFVMEKGRDKEDLVRLRKEICQRYIPNRSYRISEYPSATPSQNRRKRALCQSSSRWLTHHAGATSGGPTPRTSYATRRSPSGRNRISDVPGLVHRRPP